MFLESYRNAVLRYPEYLEEIKKKEGLESFDNEDRLRQFYGNR